jgi:hypothetical protein
MGISYRDALCGRFIRTLLMDISYERFKSDLRGLANSGIVVSEIWNNRFWNSLFALDRKD